MSGISAIKKTVKHSLFHLARRVFFFKCQPFPSVISNDCFGAEVYRALNLPYNTPFVGLMIMAPCYIRLLEDLEYYLAQQLVFIKKSKYDSVNKLMDRAGYFPIATLGGDVEIQFLHYESEEQARQKWTERKKRVDLKNLVLKFDFSKDYATEEILNQFLKLNYQKKIAIGAASNKVAEFNGATVSLPNYESNGLLLFRRSLRYIDFENFFLSGILTRPSTVKGLLLSKCLNNEWQK